MKFCYTFSHKIRFTWKNIMHHLFSKLSNVEGMNAKSNVITSLLWLFFLTLLATIACGIWVEKDFILYFLLSFLGLEIIAIVIAYGYFAHINPDYLRSETFTLNKIAIERGHIGDSNRLINSSSAPTSTITIIDGEDTHGK
ncbi:hypothetical protein FHQ28_05450 [Pasteurellaceae bacterium USgator11]|nr:hypothetical protein FHQ19_09345 [Pasteurellaceae bacterium UScroc12]TNG94761.1 hypothetical protein FHQ20_08190 [Pasteurellaceae bacterium USgator41]TNG97732.1 hypothetical protein FHQ24_09980 [Pasteurellaceae bacterium UScroc31]TNH01693.1 hypothetical protein FHQ28_05450 [Pasteurellaceae bacterium USgator11]